MNSNYILNNWEEILLPLVPDAERQGNELIAKNPRRNDENPGSFRLNIQTGVWADFALDDVKGRSPVSFIAYVLGCSRHQARHWATKRLDAIRLKGSRATNKVIRKNCNEPAAEAILPIPPAAENPPLPDRHGYPVKEWTYRNKVGEPLFIVRRYSVDGGKEIRVWTYRSSGKWAAKKPPKPWPLFNLDLLAKDTEALVLLAEGEKAAVQAGNLGGIGTTALNGSSGVKDADLEPLAGRDVIILPDADEPGRKYALDLITQLQGKAASLRIVDVWSFGWKEGEDVADHPELPPAWVAENAIPVENWLQGHPRNHEKVELKQGRELIQERVEELANLDPMDYELQRAQVAEELQVRTCVLDDWVRKRRDELNPVQNGAGQSLTLEDPEPWEDSIEGTQLAQELVKTFTRYLVLPTGGAEALALWTIHSHCFEAAEYSPHLIVISPVKRSGKSTVLRVLKELCSKALSVEHCTVSALFRSVERIQPTVLLDEADSYLAQDELLRGLLNSSFQRGGGVLRVEGEEREPRFFPTFTPTALASIKDLPGTIMDRALVLRMKRKAPGENVEKFRRPARSACLTTKRKLVRWAKDNVEALADLRPRLPDSLNDREADFWEPLFQIAAKLGPAWEKRTFQIAQTLQAEEAADVADFGLELLADIRTMVPPLGVERFTSEWLRYELGTLEGRPWSIFSDRGLITQLDLAKCLKPFGIRPKQLRMEARTVRRPEQTKENYKGYSLAQFTDAWARYLGAHETTQTKDPSPPNTLPGRRLQGLHPLQDDEGSAKTILENANIDPVDPVDVYREVIGDSIPHPTTRARIPLFYLTDPQEAKAELTSLTFGEKVLGADTETTGLDPRKADLRLVQVTDGERALVLDINRMGVPVQEVLEPLVNARLVFHNVQFDLGFLQVAGVRLKEVSCTQLEVAALTHDPMISLAKACKQFLGVEVKKELQTSDWTQSELTLDQIRYAATDALLTLALHDVLVQKLKDWRTVRGFQLVRKCIPPIADAIARGVLLDRDLHAALVNRWTRERDAALQRLQEVLGPEVNPESGKQLSKWLETHLREDTRASWPMTSKGQLATDRDTLEAFSEVELVRPLLTYRRISHRLKTWGTTYQRHVTPDGRIHPGFLLLGARSGRMSCRSPNVQNLPRDPDLRACFCAPTGYVLLAADFSQIELRIAGLLSEDPVILSAYREGRDLHRGIVSKITGKPEAAVTDRERKLGKALNFGLLYGAGPKTFRTRAQVDYGLEFSMEEAVRFKSVFDQTYSRLRWWQMEQQRSAEQTGRLKTVGGRVIAFRDPANCYTDSRNYPVQSAAADLQLLAVQKVHRALEEKALPAHLVNFVHDELVLEVWAEAAEEVSRLVQNEMTRAFIELFKDYPAESLAHGLVEVGTGANYAEVK